MYNDDYDQYPCGDCAEAEYCDQYEARFCCKLCKYNGGGDDEDCDMCDPGDI